MAVDKAEDSVVQGELHHDSALPPVADHVLHDQVLARVPHEAAVLVFDPDTHEDLALDDELDPEVLLAEVARDQVDLFLVGATTLLTSKDYDAIVLVVREHRLEVDSLWFSCMIPRHTHNIKRDLTLNQIFHHD